MSEPHYSFQPPGGLLARCQQWEDLLPWLNLLRALKPASSLVGVLLTLFAMWLTPLGLIGLTALQGASVSDAASPGAAWRIPPQMPGEPMFNFGRWLQGDDWLMAAGDFRQAATYYAQPLRSQRHAVGWASFGQLLGDVFCWWWLALVWSIPAGWIMRQTALDVAGRNRQPSRACAITVARRIPIMLTAPFIALLLVGCLFVLAWGLSWLGQSSPGLSTVSDIASSFLTPLWLAGGLLAISVLLAWPLMWAAAVLEQDADPFDILSRGFEYLWRRPVHAVFYALVAWVFSIIFQQAVGGACGAAQHLVSNAALLAGGLPSLSAQALLSSLAVAFSINYFWAAMAVIYLLLRRDTNHVELDAVWEPPVVQGGTLPSLPSGSAGSAAESVSTAHPRVAEMTRTVRDVEDDASE